MAAACFRKKWRSGVNHKAIHCTLGTVALLAGIFTATSLSAQQPNLSSGSNAPAERLTPTPQTSPSGHPEDAYWNAHDRQLLVDFGDLARFKDANETLGAPKPGEKRVIFMGDSITQGWNLAESFPGKPYVNRGISGQTTPQMLVRFRQDVIDLNPKVVIILAGTNDIAGNTGPMTLDQTEGNIASMAELATANGIQVVICSILPAFDYKWAPGREPAPKILKVNAWLKEYAAREGYVYVDYYAAMKDDRGGLPPTLSKDGVHPLPAGFAIMTPLAQAGIEQALQGGMRHSQTK